MKAVPIITDTTLERQKPSSRADAQSSLVFGGHPPPKLDTPYQATVREKKDTYHAISMMKVRCLLRHGSIYMSSHKFIYGHTHVQVVYGSCCVILDFSIYQHNNRKRVSDSVS